MVTKILEALACIEIWQLLELSQGRNWPIERAAKASLSLCVWYRKYVLVSYGVSGYCTKCQVQAILAGL